MTVINKLVKDSPNTVLVDSGNQVLSVPSVLPTAMSFLADLHYDAVGLGVHDLSMEDAYFAEAQKQKLTVLDSRPDAPKSSLPFVVKNINGVKVGIVSFGGLGEHTCGEYERRKAMYKAFKAAREHSDLLIVLDQANVITADWLARNEKRLGAPDIVVAGLQKAGLDRPEIVGRCHMVPTGIDGKRVGVVDVEIDPGAAPRLAWSRVMLDLNVVEDEQARIRLAEARQRRDASGAEQAVAGLAQASTAPNPQPAQKNPYYSPDLCRACHVKQYEDWAKTRHAAAVTTLLREKRMAPACLQCHSEEYVRVGQVTMPGRDGVGGVGCGTCHLEALPHGLERKSVAAKTNVNPRGCLQCHNSERSPAYDEQAYFPKVSHFHATSSQSASSSGLKLR